MTEDLIPLIGNEAKGKLCWKELIRAIFISVAALPRGMTYEIVGPALPYLRDQLGVTLSQVASALSLRHTGLVIGSILGGYLFKNFPVKSNAIVGICYILIAVTLSVTPWLTDLGLLILLFFLQGLFIGTNLPGVTDLAMVLPGGKVGLVVMFQYASQGFGGMMMPYLVKSFLTVRPLHIDEVNNSFVDISATNVSEATEFNVETAISNVGEFLPNQGVLVEVALQYPYLIAAAATACMASGFFIMQIVYKHQHESPEKDGYTSLPPDSHRKGQKTLKMVDLLFLIWLFFHMFGTESVLSAFQYSYMLNSDQGFSTTDAATVNTIYWMCVVFGLCFNPVGAAFLRPNVHFSARILIGALTSVALFLWGSASKLAFSLLICFLGFSAPSFLPLAITWADQYIDMTVSVMGLAYCGAGVGAMSYLALAGYLFDNFGTSTFLVVVLSGLGNISIIYIILQVLSSKNLKMEKVATP